MEQRVCIWKPVEINSLHINVTDSEGPAGDHLQNQVV